MRFSHRLLVIALVLLSVLSCTSSSGGGDGKSARGPYLQIATPTSLLVRWRSLDKYRGTVRFGTDPNALTSIASDANSRADHHVQLEGLAPETKYFYSIGTPARTVEGDDTYFFTTPPSVGEEKPTRIWALGDMGTGGTGQRLVRESFESFNGGLPPDLWLLLGDNVYPDGTDQQYTDFFFSVYPRELRQTLLWPCMGNHETHKTDPNGKHAYYNIFSLPTQGEAGGIASGTERYYSFDHANIHFICLDPVESETDPSGRMMTWAADDLAATEQDWIVGFWHFPPYTKGSHDSDTENGLIRVHQDILPVLEDAGIDLVLSGHSHAYERSFLINGHYGDSSTFDNSMLIDGGSGRLPNAYEPDPGPNHGTVYVVAGSGGQLSGGPFDHPVMFKSILKNGSLVIDVEGGTLTVNFLTSDGDIDDSFTILKPFVVGQAKRFDRSRRVAAADRLRTMAKERLHRGENN